MVSMNPELRQQLQKLDRPYQKWWDEELQELDAIMESEFQVNPDMISFAPRRVQEEYALRQNQIAEDIIESAKTNPFDADPYPVDVEMMDEEPWTDPEPSEGSEDFELPKKPKAPTA